jgi:hypothetical protein
VSVTADAGTITQGTIDRLTERDADVFGRMMIVNVQVPRRRDLQVDQRVLGKQVQHVVEEADTTTSFTGTLSIQLDGQVNLGFAGLAVNRCGSGHVKCRQKGEPFFNSLSLWESKVVNRG